MKKRIAPDELWKKQMIKLRRLFPQLTDTDFQYDYGKREVMLMALQDKLGKSRTELNVLFRSLQPSMPGEINH